MYGWRMAPENISLPFKTMRNIKTADPIFTMNSFYD